MTQNGQSKQDRVSARDAAFLSPSERARVIFDFIELDGHGVGSPFYWDALCFSAENLAAFALASEHKILTSLMKAVMQEVYALHYLLPLDQFSEISPSRAESERLWKERLKLEESPEQ